MYYSLVTMVAINGRCRADGAKIVVFVTACLASITIAVKSANTTSKQTVCNESFFVLDSCS